MPEQMENPEEMRKISKLAISTYLFVFLGVVGLPLYVLYKEDKNHQDFINSLSERPYFESG